MLANDGSASHVEGRCKPAVGAEQLSANGGASYTAIPGATSLTYTFTATDAGTHTFTGTSAVGFHQFGSFTVSEPTPF